MIAIAVVAGAVYGIGYLIFKGVRRRSPLRWHQHVILLWVGFTFARGVNGGSGFIAGAHIEPYSLASLAVGGLVAATWLALYLAVIGLIVLVRWLWKRAQRE